MSYAICTAESIESPPTAKGISSAALSEAAMLEDIQHRVASAVTGILGLTLSHDTNLQRHAA
jgi:hypothetical protein